MANKLAAQIVPGTTSFSDEITLYLAGTTNGATGMDAADVANGNLVYYRQGAAAVVSVAVVDLAALNTAFADGGLKELSSTLMPGKYRIDWPDAAFAVSGAGEWVTFYLSVSGCNLFEKTFWFGSYLPQDALHPTTAGRTLDVASTGEAGLDFDNVKAATAPTTLTNITVPTVATTTNLTNLPATAALSTQCVEILASLQNAKVTLDPGGMTGTIQIYTPGTAQSGGNLLRTIPFTTPTALTITPPSLNRVT